MKSSHVNARACALKLLSYRSRSKKELFEKLERKGFSRQEIVSTIDSLEKAGLISDEHLAAELLRFSVERKFLGKRSIEAFLFRRGIGRELVHQTLSTHTNNIETESAEKFVEKKLKSLKKYPADAVKQKLWGMLQRRGFSIEVIKQVLDSRKI